MKKFSGFLWLIIVAVAFPFLISAAQQEDIFGGDNVETVIAKAEAGDAEAQMALAQRYRFGAGVPRDTAMAVEWFQKAAEQGNVQGEFSVGFMYAVGEDGFERDTTIAAEWFRRAAENGHPNAQLNLGNMYRMGDGVERDLEKALLWLQKAADHGNTQAQIEINRITSNSDIFPEDNESAIVLSNKMLDKQSANADFALAQKYINGDGVARDPLKAIELYQKAADQGSVGAQINLANIYAKGEITRKNLGAAMELYLKAAEQGERGAQYQVGLLYYSGQGVKKDRAAAAQWFRKAADQHHNLAQEDLSRMYLKGEGVKKDEIEGLAWLYLADSYDPRPIAFFANSDIAALEKKLGAKKTLAARLRSGELRQAINAEISAKTGIPTPELVGNPISSGAGVFISRNGLILTAARVVASAGSIKIKTAQYSQTFSAKILEIDLDNDIAILKYDGSAKPLPVINSGHIRVDQDTFAILSPRSVENLQGVSYSLIKVLGLTGVKKNPGYLQIGAHVTVAPSPGAQMSEDVLKTIRANSSERLFPSVSGPLLDESGNLIGMIPHQAVNNDGSFYATRSEVLQPLLEKHGVEVIEKPENETGKTGGKNAAGFAVPPMQSLFGSIVIILTY